ncbi:GATA zinc finger domain-containing protein 14-like [Oppia nitens]|uniref:GATA zinc finger domain-containing protein 14-like n=1 Tax=Oppia nitens TaxID=1686743 RepID=UPI0023DAEAEB|nr:GATA zinc finger domain-containing protein 14-like [Oppia nitens]XP_054156584.1 GATA zinc finger domain-containing protein 14-like [Oppia nitens]
MICQFLLILLAITFLLCPYAYSQPLQQQQQQFNNNNQQQQQHDNNDKVTNNNNKDNKPANNVRTGSRSAAYVGGGQREYYIPTYNNPQPYERLVEEAEEPEVLYNTNNFGNSYQYNTAATAADYNVADNRQQQQRQPQWHLTPTLGHYSRQQQQQLTTTRQTSNNNRLNNNNNYDNSNDNSFNNYNNPDITTSSNSQPIIIKSQPKLSHKSSSSSSSSASSLANDYKHRRPSQYPIGPNDEIQTPSPPAAAAVGVDANDGTVDDNSRQRLRSITNKLIQFNDEQQQIANRHGAGGQHHHRNTGGGDIQTADDNSHHQQQQQQPEQPTTPNFYVMRRKSANSGGGGGDSALQVSANHRNIPVPMARQQEATSINESANGGSLGDVYFVALVACVSSVAIFGVIGAGICVYKVQQSNKAAADVDYPAYGVVGPASKKETNSTGGSGGGGGGGGGTGGGGNVSPSGDRKLAQSAQMYHYHHQKQQMIASEKAVTTNRRNSASDVESDEENEEGEYTVYECPGLAPTGEMEVKNPLFHDDITPVSSPPVVTGGGGNNSKDK